MLDPVRGKAGKVQFNMYLPANLVRRVKHQEIDAGVSLSVLVERSPADYLTRHQETE